ncbi:hypothetical protein F2P81_023025 [Scophthalmus maximus]|uniref:Uncharacterized protein n=1 Tax=Scophthalmus maximus TaxID=52904 RepID=A0A6A4RQF3_SCOMX|nr:hypothetical protein F2P81_023025 [Scophthalmus maximus]
MVQRTTSDPALHRTGVSPVFTTTRERHMAMTTNRRNKQDYRHDRDRPPVTRCYNLAHSLAASARHMTTIIPEMVAKEALSLTTPRY